MIVLQQGTGAYEPLLDLVAPLNAAKCKAQGMEYREIREQRLKGRYKPREKYVWVEEAIEADDVLWIDADVWLCGDEGLNQLNGAHLAGVRNGDGEINTGVVWFKRCAEVVAFLKSIGETLKDAMTLRSTEWAEQWHVNQRLPFSGLTVNVLDARWNAYRNVMSRPTPPIQIWTCHSTMMDVKEKTRRMKAMIERGAA